MHIGTHKTGSTAIQRWLKVSEKQLLSEGLAGLWLPSSDVQTLMRCRERDEELIGRLACQVKRQARKHQAKGVFRFVLSHEGFSGDPNTGYDNASIVARSVREISCGFTVWPIVYLRRQDQFLESLYTQTIHTGASCSFDAFAASFDDTAFDWSRLLEAYEDVFGRQYISPRRYDGRYLPETRSLLDDFAEIIGTDALATCQERTPNAGYTRDALEMAIHAGKSLTPREKQWLRTVLQSVSARQPFQTHAFLDASGRRALLERYAASNSKVAELYFGESELFPDAGDVEPYRGLSPEAAGRILGETIKFLKKEVEDKSLFRIVLSRLRRRICRIGP